MKATGPFQEFESLTPEEFHALENDILENGVQVPIIFDEDGRVIDGHHRLTVCQKHGITNYPRDVRTGLTDDEKKDLAQSLNMSRRSLTREQRQRQIQNRLQRHPEHSDRKIASALGVDHKTVGRIRKQLESSGEVPQVTSKVGLNGMSYTPPASRKMVDAEGGEVPQRLEKTFSLRSEFQSLINTIGDIKRRSVELSERSPLQSQIVVLKRHLDNATALLEQSIPHAVHSTCKGAGCDDCHGRGYITGGEVPQHKATASSCGSASDN